MPLVFGSYEKFYGLKGLMDRAIRPQYLQAAKEIYNKTYDWSKGLPNFPAIPSEFLTDEIIGEISSGTGAFMNYVRRSTTLQGRYKNPTTFFGGGDDAVAPEQFSVTMPVEFQATLGSSRSTGKSMGPEANHRSTFLASMFNQDMNVLDIFNANLA